METQGTWVDWARANPAVVGLVGVLIGGFLTALVLPLVKSGLEKAATKVMSKWSLSSYSTRYLRKLINEHQYLPTLPTTLVPVTERHTPEIDELYVDLEVADHAPSAAQRITLPQLLKEQKRIVILGDPGSGKTTLLKYLALMLGRAKLNSRAAADSQLTRAARNLVKETYHFSFYPIPIMVYLNRFRGITEWPENKNLLDAVIDDLKASGTLGGLPSTFFEKHLDSGRCVFLFDAFDELASADARDEVARRLGELASSTPAGNTFIVTSRVVGYNGQLARYGFQPLKVQTLSWDLISILVRKWYQVLGEPKLANDLLETLKSNARIADLAVNPMLLSLIVLVQYVKRVIPDRRHVLYEECLRILVERRYAPPPIQEEYNRLLPGDEAIRLLRDVAFTMHERKIREITRLNLEQDVVPKALQDMKLSRAFAVPPPDLIRNIESRSQLLVERGLDASGAPVMAFSHLTFQEYLCSVHFKNLAEKSGEKWASQQVTGRYETDPEWWEEVALLYAAQLDQPQQTSFFSRLRQTEHVS
jgi:predicted NACHT family NTPase